MNRAEILNKAQKLISEDRAKEYGPVEDNWERIAQIWTALKGVEFTASDVGLFMIGVKLARLSKNPNHMDSYVDIAGYSGLTGEINDSDINS